MSKWIDGERYIEEAWVAGYVDQTDKRISDLEAKLEKATEDAEHFKECFEESMDSLNYTVVKLEKAKARMSFLIEHGYDKQFCIDAMKELEK